MNGKNPYSNLCGFFGVDRGASHRMISLARPAGYVKIEKPARRCPRKAGEVHQTGET